MDEQEIDAASTTFALFALIVWLALWGWLCLSVWSGAPGSREQVFGKAAPANTSEEVISVNNQNDTEKREGGRGGF